MYQTAFHVAPELTDEEKIADALRQWEAAGLGTCDTLKAEIRETRTEAKPLGKNEKGENTFERVPTATVVVCECASETHQHGAPE